MNDDPDVIRIAKPLDTMVVPLSSGAQNGETRGEDSCRQLFYSEPSKQGLWPRTIPISSKKFG